MRWLAAVALIVIHLALVATGDALPAAIAPAIAATIYLPLWPLSAIGVTVFSPAESGGWASPSVLGWLVFVAVWSLLWWTLVAVILRMRS
jgi:hypothetical protein